jgi:hypothetical protein
MQSSPIFAEETAGRTIGRMLLKAAAWGLFLLLAVWAPLFGALMWILRV